MVGLWLGIVGLGFGVRVRLRVRVKVRVGVKKRPSEARWPDTKCELQSLQKI